MARLREDIPVDQPDQSKATTQSKRTRPRIIVYLKDDGSIDNDALSEEQRAKLQTATTPAGTVPPGVASSAPGAAVESVSPDAVKGILMMLVSIETTIVASKMELPPDQVARAMQPPAPMEAALVDSTTRVLNKYGGTLGRYADELTLISVLIVWQSHAFRELRAIQARQPKPRIDPKPAPVDIHESSTIRQMPDGALKADKV